VVWEGALDPFQEGFYNISVSVNGGVRLFIGGSLLIDSWETSVPSSSPPDSISSPFSNQNCK